MKINLMQIEKHCEVADGIRRLVLSGRLEAEPGQFVHVSVSETLDPLLRRPLSIHDCTEDKTVLLYRVCGRGTDLLSGKKPGEVLDVLGPLGNGFAVADSEEAVLVAGGIGIAPLFFLARILWRAGKKVHFFAGAKNSLELYLPEEIGKVATSVVLATDDGTAGHRGLVTEPASIALEETDAPVYCCGPPPMMREVVRLSARFKRDVFVSLEAQMACGVGACQGCVTAMRANGIDYSRICTDGPVFRGEDVFL
ncbi:MAG: dihydroorotate dehydrogenase electron transfer subunit [Dethiobacter sp.]|nr:dihydroorotate dehydrogenase electron transfer subunit [Dethiobacter sp.]